MAARALTDNVDDLALLAGLFGVAFIAATVLPAQSEAALVGLLAAGTHSTVMLVAVATVGNVLASVGAAVTKLLRPPEPDDAIPPGP